VRILAISLPALLVPVASAQSFELRLPSAVTVTPGHRTVVPAEIVNTGTTTLGFASNTFNQGYGLSGVTVSPGSRAGIVLGSFVAGAAGGMPAGFLFKLAPAFGVVEPSGAITGFNFAPDCSNAVTYQVTDVLNGAVPGATDLVVSIPTDSMATSGAPPGSILACLSYVPGIPAGWGLAPFLGGNPSTPSLTISGTGLPGGTADVNTFGMTGDVYVQFFSFATASLPTALGTVWIALPATPFLTGVVQPSGADRVSIPIPAGAVGPATIQVQGAVARMGQLFLTNRAAITIP
jgi:hypothetical protein